MIVKDKFQLLKNTPNILNLSKSQLEEIEIEDGDRKLYVTLNLAQNRINHFTKKALYNLIEKIHEREKRIKLINYPDYPLVVTYNKPTGHMIINVGYFGNPDVSYIDSKDIYGSYAYAYCFSSLAAGKINLKEEFAPPICAFLLSMFVRVFGKEYGLLGAYSKEIVKLKFLINCYVLKSFFGSSGNIYKKSLSLSGFDYKEIKNELDLIDFSDILGFIDSLSKFNVFPGINRYSFSSKFLKFLSLNFIPALEDLSRFISIMTVSSLTGVSLIPTFIKYYNQTEFEKILNISKRIFK